MKKRVKNFAKNIIENVFDKLHIFLLRRGEKIKFHDARRKKIYDSVLLTKSQKKSIDELYEKNYGKRIPYTWHRHFTAFTGKFDKYYFPELLYIPEFEYYMNLNKYFCKVLEDKNILPIIAKNIHIDTPEIIVSCASGMYYDGNYNSITKENIYKTLCDIGKCFAKPSVDAGSGKGCRIYTFKNGEDINTKESIVDIVNQLGDNFVIQKVIKCHSSISKIYSNSVNTFRIITYRWHDEIMHTPSVMRIGQGGNYLDNAHAGGIFIAINDDGTLHEKAFTEFKNEFIMHPDSKFKFDGYKIDLFPKVLEAAIRMHKAVPQVGSVNWDFTIDENGKPILIEANVNGGGIWVVQMAHGKGPFGELTPEILKWLKLMRKTKVEKRYLYEFGKNGDR